MIWTDEAKRRVAEMLRRDMTAREIGDALGVPRKSVIGIVGRDPYLKTIGFSYRPGSRNTKVKIPSTAYPAPDSIGVSMTDLRAFQCRWPINDAKPGEEHLFCGMRKVSGSSYCEHHKQASAGRGTPSERRAVREAERLAA